MKKVVVNLFTVDELDEKAKEKVLDEFRHFNVEYAWWDCTTDDAHENIGLKVIEFDASYYHKITTQLTISAIESIEKVLNEYGEPHKCYKIAKSYEEQVRKLHRLVNRYTDLVNYTNYGAKIWRRYDAKLNYYETDLQGLTEDYRKEMSKAVLDILVAEYEELISDEYVLESIRSNDYLFTCDGRRFGMPYSEIEEEQCS